MIKKFTQWTAVMVFTVNLSFAQSNIPTDFFGVNGWMNYRIGPSDNYDCYGLNLGAGHSDHPCLLWGEFDKSIIPASPTGCPSKVQNLYTKLIRYGGIMNDWNKPTNDQFLREIDLIRSVGAEPIIQIPYGEGHYTATDASTLLTYLNTTKGKKIKYIEICNEPDGYDTYPTTLGTLTAQFIADYFKPIATALKNVDPDIQIIGPSLAWYDNATIAKLLSDPSNPSNTYSIAGKDANGHYYLDIVDFHYYPWPKTGYAQDRTNIIANPVAKLDDYLGNTTTGLVHYLDVANAFGSPARGTTANPLKFSISEININFKNPTSNEVTGFGANSFIAGQWMAECYSIALARGKNATGTTSKVAFISPWSFYEGGNKGETDAGIINGTNPCTTNVERSTYYHMAMMGQYFKGQYYSATCKNSTGGTITDVKAFGSYLPSGGYAIMIMNQSETASYTSYTITSNGTSTSPLNINLAISGTSATYTYSGGIDVKTTHLILLDCSGTLVKILRYNETNDAANYGIPYQLTSGAGTPPITLSVSSVNTNCSSNNGSATVTATGGTGSYTYSWLPTGGSGGSTATYSGLAAGIYTVTVSNSTGTCNASVSTTITIGKKSPIVNINTNNNNSCATGSTTFSATTGFSSYSWSPGGQTTSSITVNQPGTNGHQTYTVTATDGTTGCSNTSSVTYYGQPTVSISGTSSTGNNCGVVLTASSIPGSAYVWKISGSPVGTGRTLDLTCGSAATYSVEVTLPYLAYPCSTSLGSNTYTATYTVTNSGTPCTPAGTASATSTILCGGSSSTLSLASNMSSDIHWQMAYCGSSDFTDISGAIASTYTVTQSFNDDGNQYRAKVTCSGTDFYSNVKTIRERAGCHDPLPEECPPAGSPAPRLANKGDISYPFNLHPNPNNGSMILSYELALEEKGSVVIYDVTGRKISEYMLQQDKNNLPINENNMQNGIYFYTVLVNDRVVNKGKIVIIK